MAEGDKGTDLAQVFFQEGPDLAPAVHGLLLAIHGPVIIEEAVTRAIVAVELVILAVFLQFLFVLVHLFRRWRLVIVAEETQQGARQVGSVVEGGHRLIGGQIIPGSHNPAAPAVDGGVEALNTAGGEEGKAAAGAGAEDAHLAVQDWAGCE